MAEPREPTCAGQSAGHDCGALPLYVTTPMNGQRPKYACGRHIGWLLRYRTVPGGSLLVTRLGAPSSAVRYDRGVLADVLTYHQRKDASSCACGWSVIGASHAEHVTDVYQHSVMERV